MRDSNFISIKLNLRRFSEAVMRGVLKHQIAYRLLVNKKSLLFEGMKSRLLRINFFDSSYFAGVITMFRYSTAV